MAAGVGMLQLLDPGVAERARTWEVALATSPGHQPIEHILALVAGLPPDRLEILGIGALLYAALFTAEGAGLWLGRRWAEYLTLVATASLVPFEVFEVAHRLSLPRVGALALNLAVVVYLWRRVRRSRGPAGRAAG